MHDDKWHPSPKTAPLLSFTSHNEKVGKEEVRCKQGEGERVSKAADRLSSLSLIGLHRRKWFTALLSQFTLAVQIYARYRFIPADPDLQQLQIYTRVMAFASDGTKLLPSGGILYFLNGF